VRIGHARQLRSGVSSQAVKPPTTVTSRHVTRHSGRWTAWLSASAHSAPTLERYVADVVKYRLDDEPEVRFESAEGDLVSIPTRRLTGHRRLQTIIREARAGR